MLHTDDVMEILFWQWQTARIWSKTFGPFVFLQVKDSFNKCYSPLKVELHDTATYSKTQVNVFSEEVKKKKKKTRSSCLWKSMPRHFQEKTFVLIHT